MKRLLEHEGQLRLVCADLDRSGFYRWERAWSPDPLYFDEAWFERAVDTHAFVPWLHDGGATFLVCEACDAELWVPDPESEDSVHYDAPVPREGEGPGRQIRLRVGSQVVGAASRRRRASSASRSFNRRRRSSFRARLFETPAGSSTRSSRRKDPSSATR